MSDRRFDFQFVDSESRIPDALWEACFPPTIEGRWWYRTLETCGLEDQFRFSYAVIHEGARPVGIAPTFLMSLPLSLVLPDPLVPFATWLEKVAPQWRPRTLFVGSPCADEGTVGLLPGVDRQLVLLTLHRALEDECRKQKASILVWKDVPPALARDLTWVASRTRLFPMVSFPGTLVPLPATKEAYLAALSSSRRQRFKRKLRRSMDRIDVEVEAIQHPDQRTLDEIFGLFWQVYECGRTKFEKLNRRFFEIIAENPVSHFIVLREKVSGEMVAFMLCFVLGDRVVNKFVGHDCVRPRNLFLPVRLWDAVLDWAIARGATSIQSGQTGYATKLMTGHGLVPLSNFCHHRNPIVHSLYRAIGQKIRWETLDDDLAVALAAHPELKAKQRVEPA